MKENAEPNIEQKDTIKRRVTRQVKIKNLPLGGNAPISIQSMTKTPTADVRATVEQILQYQEAGCEIVRLTVNHNDAALALEKILPQVNIPVVADIHFDHRLALQALKFGIHKIRMNPGNIGKEEKIKEVLTACKNEGVPIRIGVNSGSLEKDIQRKYGFPCSDAMVESALRHIEICDKYNFNDVVISLKSSDVFMMIEAYRKLAKLTDLPFHLGVTEAGSRYAGTIKSSIGIGTLLAEGIGDTIRVSLTDDGVEEIKAGREILKSLNLTGYGVNLVSCPTCGRLQVDMIPIVNEVEKAVSQIKTPLKVAIMGCLVNGPGEAKDADIGISCSKDSAIFYVHGKSRGSIDVKDIVPNLLNEIEILSEEKKQKI